MKIERYWAMPNKWTFTIPPIAELLKEEIKGLTLSDLKSQIELAYKEK